MKIIAFGHKARQGKTWSANFLASRLPGRSFVWGFGDGLKAVARAGYGMGIKKDARLLQSVGQSLREADPGVWIRVFEGALVDQELTPEWVLIPDLRYVNEALWLKSRGAILVKVSRQDPLGRPFLDPGRDSNHPSEVDLDGFPDWDLQITAASLGQLGFVLTESFLSEQIQRPDMNRYHLHSGFALGPT